MKMLIYERGPYAHAINATEAWGGAEKQQWVLSRELVRRGHEVTIVVNTNEPDDVLPEVEGVRFVTVPMGNSIPKLYRVLQQEKPDWYYRRTAQASLGPAVMVAKSLGVRAVYACAFDTDTIPQRALSRQKRLWYLYKLGLDLSDRILVQHIHQMNMLAPGYRYKANQVNNIVDLPEERPVKQNYVAWVVAALRTTKRPELLIEVAKALPDVTFVVCGVPKAHRGTLEYGNKIVEEFGKLPNIDYRGSVPPEEARRIISESQVFLSTSSGEGFPNTMLEAWSGYTPVISMDLDPGSVIAKYNNGLVVDSVDAFVNALSKLLDDADYRQQLGDNGRNYVESEHTAGRVYEQFKTALGF